MGCCVSTSTAADRSDKNSGEFSDKNRDPPQPPSIAEEETVKEVLSETTLLTSSTEEDPVTESKTQKLIMEKIREGDDDDKPGIRAARGMTRPDLIDPNPEDGSEVSEICSLSVSESVCSTVVNAYDEEEEVKPRKLQVLRQRSPAKPRARVTGNGYPTRRSEQSPAKRSVGGGGGSVRIIQPSPGRRSGSGTLDPADRSGRRSRSPATNRSVMSPGLGTGSEGRRKNSQSPGRVRLDPSKNGSEQLGQWPAGNYNCAPRESLENPLVSLECFIFL